MPETPKPRKYVACKSPAAIAALDVAEELARSVDDTISDPPKPRTQVEYPLGPCGEGGIRDARGNIIATMYYLRDDRTELRDLFIACVNAMYEAEVRNPESLPVVLNHLDLYAHPGANEISQMALAGLLSTLQEPPA